MAVDNSSYLSVHCYIVQEWARVPLLVSLQKVTGSATLEHLTDLIISAVSSGGGLDGASLAKKVICFGTDGASTL